MDAINFFMNNLGKHFVEPRNSTLTDLPKVLNANLPKGVLNASGMPATCRLVAGWAIIRPGSVLWKTGIHHPAIESASVEMAQAYANELKSWDGIEPRMFLQFGKIALTADQLFLSLDKRLVKICKPGGTLLENWLENPPKPKKKEQTPKA